MTGCIRFEHDILVPLEKRGAKPSFPHKLRMMDNSAACGKIALMSLVNPVSVSIQPLRTPVYMLRFLAEKDIAPFLA
jgi:hypothetical protein